MLVEYNAVQLLPLVNLERLREHWEAEAGKGGVQTSDLTSPPPLGREILERPTRCLVADARYRASGSCDHLVVAASWSEICSSSKDLVRQQPCYKVSHLRDTLVSREAIPTAQSWTAGQMVDVQSHCICFWVGKRRVSRAKIVAPNTFDFAR